MLRTPPIVLTIAGFDPSSGAGITADIKTIGAHGCYGIACITALTVQSTLGVRRVQPLAAELVAETLEELSRDVVPAAVHIGMLSTGDVVRVVVDYLRKHSAPKVVLDPILQSSSGATLLDYSGKILLLKELLPIVSVLTPNVDEAAQLTGIPVGNLDQMRSATVRLHSLGADAVVVTGGHLAEPTDLLSIRTQGGVRSQVFGGAKQRTTSTHGSGCAFATSLACNLGLGMDLPDAVRKAKDYVSKAMAAAYPVGQGLGPLNHLFRK